MYFLPYSFSREIFKFSAPGKTAAEFLCFRSYRKTQMMKTGIESCKTQNPQGIFGKSIAYMSQHAVFQIFLSVIRIDKPALIVFGYGIDCEIPAQKVFLYGDVRTETADESGITVAFLAFGSGKSIFF